MKLDAPKSVNYAAQVISVPVLVDLPGLDNLVGVPALGHQALSWDGVKEFCTARGLKWTPELCRSLQFHPASVDELVENLMDDRYQAGFPQALPLSDKGTVDEGVCLRQEGLVPTILKAKSPKFLEHETKLLDAGEIDTESAA